jgi:hypothetical protein
MAVTMAQMAERRGGVLPPIQPLPAVDDSATTTAEVDAAAAETRLSP